MPSPAFQVLLYEVEGHICTITMNRPEKRNALSLQLVNELIFALETAGADDEVRVIILTGAGSAFCAVADLSPMTGGGRRAAGAVREIAPSKRTWCSRPARPLASRRWASTSGPCVPANSAACSRAAISTTMRSPPAAGPRQMAGWRSIA